MAFLICRFDSHLPTYIRTRLSCWVHSIYAIACSSRRIMVCCYPTGQASDSLSPCKWDGYQLVLLQQWRCLHYKRLMFLSWAKRGLRRGCTDKTSNATECLQYRTEREQILLNSQSSAKYFRKRHELIPLLIPRNGLSLGGCRPAPLRHLPYLLLQVGPSCVRQ